MFGGTHAGFVMGDLVLHGDDVLEPLAHVHRVLGGEGELADLLGFLVED